MPSRTAEFKTRIANWCLSWVPVLWVCRVGVVSVLIGILLYWFVPQAHDLFADTAWLTAAGGWATWYWFWSLLFVAIFWAGPVHFNGRQALDDDAWLLPRVAQNIASMACEAAIVAGLRQHYRFQIDWAPRILGMLPFVAIGLGVEAEAVKLRTAEGLKEAAEALQQIQWLRFGNAAAALLFLLLVAYRAPILNWIAGRREAAGKGAFLWAALEWALSYQRVLPEMPLSATAPPSKGRRAAEWAASRADRLLVNLPRVVTIAAFLLALFLPVRMGDLLPRALLVPLLFGGATLLLGWIARGSDRTGLPLVPVALVAVALVTAWHEHFHDVRTANGAGGTEQVGSRVRFEAAVAQWKAANGCADGQRVCPPALIVAAEGGASRAAFFTATVVGHLLDTMPRDPVQPDVQRPAANRLFAISGVSGGSVGAAIISAALTGDTQAAEPPCKARPESWFRFKEKGTPMSWRQCLQALASGDALTPVFVGLGFRDNLVLWNWSDRAALLEQAFERHYHAVTAQPAADCGKDGTRGLCLRMGERGRRMDKPWAPLLFLNSTSVITGRRIIVSEVAATRTSPDGAEHGLYREAFDFFEMLAEPCSAIKTDPDRCESAKAVATAPNLTYATASIVSARFPIISPAGNVRNVDGTDVDRFVDGGIFENAGLTTAGNIAAALRDHGIIPIILHIGNDPISANTKGDCNIGAVQATPRADPHDCDPRWLVPPRTTATPTVLNGDGATFTDRLFGRVGAPLAALYDTRSGHSAEAEQRVRDVIDAVPCPLDKEGKRTCMLDINVWDRPRIADDPANPQCDKLVAKSYSLRNVSMSWWLSYPVQAFLDAQLGDCQNANVLKRLMEQLAQRPSAATGSASTGPVKE